MGLIRCNAVPTGFGFPPVPVEGYSLDMLCFQVLDVATQTPAATALNGKFLATSHTYQVDTIAKGQTTYARNGLTVPPGTTLMVVINHPIPPN